MAQAHLWNITLNAYLSKYYITAPANYVRKRFYALKFGGSIIRTNSQVNIHTDAIRNTVSEVFSPFELIPKKNVE